MMATSPIPKLSEAITPEGEQNWPISYQQRHHTSHKDVQLNAPT